MFFFIQQFLAMKAAGDAANWIADCVEDMVDQLGLTEENRHLPDFSTKVATAEFLWSQLATKFVEKSPPRWPNQAAFLKQHGIGELSLEIPKMAGVSTELLVRLCTQYFVSNFWDQCTQLARNGKSEKALNAVNALATKVNEIFENRGVFEAAKVIARSYFG